MFYHDNWYHAIPYNVKLNYVVYHLSLHVVQLVYPTL